MCNFGHGNLPGRMVDTVDTYRRKANWRSQMMAKERHCSIALCGIDKHARDDLVAVECGAVGVMGPVDTCVARGVEPGNGSVSFLSSKIEQGTFTIPTSHVEQSAIVQAAVGETNLLGQTLLSKFLDLIRLLLYVSIMALSAKEWRASYQYQRAEKHHRLAPRTSLFASKPIVVSFSGRC